MPTWTQFDPAASPVLPAGRLTISAPVTGAPATLANPLRLTLGTPPTIVTSGSSPSGAPPPPPSCPVLPTNPRAGQTGVNDPYFASQADHDAWAAANPGCPPPPYAPDTQPPAPPGPAPAPPPAPVPAPPPTLVPVTPGSVPAATGAEFPTVAVLVIGGLFAAGVWYLASESEKSTPSSSGETDKPAATTKPTASKSSESASAAAKENPFLRRMRLRSSRKNKR